MIKLQTLIRESVETDLTNLKIATKYVAFIEKEFKKINNFSEWKKSSGSVNLLLPLFKELPKSLSTMLSINFGKVKNSFFKPSMNAINFNIHYSYIELYSDFNEESYKSIKERLTTFFSNYKNIAVHEFTHFLDNLRYDNNKSVGTAFILKTRGKKAYYNTPEEFNAYTLSMINDINIKFNTRLKRIDDINRIGVFVATFGDNDFNVFLKNADPEIKRLLNLLNSKYRKHFLKRLYLHYQNWMKIWKKKKRELE